MKNVMVRYRIYEDRVADNERLIAAVFAELARVRPSGLRYRVYRDGASFMHLATVDTPDGTNPLLSLPAFKEFTSGIRERAAEPPVTVELTEIQSYG